MPLGDERVLQVQQPGDALERGVPLPAGSILGTRVLRSEDPGFLTTGAVYTDDLVDERLAGAVHATFVRSPIAHARIGSIDVSGATGMPGVVAVLTADELGAMKRGSSAGSQGKTISRRSKRCSTPTVAPLRSVEDSAVPPVIVAGCEAGDRPASRDSPQVYPGTGQRRTPCPGYG